jgi:hypothetical protein
MRDGIVLAHRVDLFSALTSEIRHATSTGEISRFTTLLNSCDTATPLPGTRHASVKSATVHILRHDRLRIGCTNAAKLFRQDVTEGRNRIMDDDTLEQQRYDATEHQKIQEWAYQNWQWRGSPIGSPEVDWFLAEENYRERHSQ